MIACCQVCFHEGRVRIHLVWKINSEGILDECEAQRDGAVIPSKRDVLFHGKHLSCFPELGFPSHTACVFFAELDEAAEVVGTCESDKTGTESIIKSVEAGSEV